MMVAIGVVTTSVLLCGVTINKKEGGEKVKGNVKFFNTTKGFGFITAEDGKDYFVHQSALKEGTVLRENDPVKFNIVEGDKGPKAENVVVEE